MQRKRIASASPYERSVGFSRAVRLGPWLAVSGTAPLDEQGKTVGAGDAYQQTHRCLTIIQSAVEAAGGHLDHVVRTRVMLTDISAWEAAARAHGEFFADIRPASTFVEVSRLIDPSWLVEIEADCLIGPIEGD